MNEIDTPKQESDPKPVKKLNLTTPEFPTRTAPAAPQQEEKRSIDDAGDNIVTAAAVTDLITDTISGEDDDDCMKFILGLAVAGVVFAYFGIKSNPDNETVQMGAYLFLAGYFVLLTRILPYFLIGGGLYGFYAKFFDDATFSIYIPLVALGAGALILLIRYLIPPRIMRGIQYASWVLMFVGPFMMKSGGADITGPLCILVSALWFILFAFNAAISALFRKIFG